MTGVELAVGYLFAWAVRKSKRVAGRADAEVDRALDAALEHLHDLVSAKLGEDPGLRRLAQEAGTGREEPDDRTRHQVRLVLDDATERDPGFARALDTAVAQVAARERAARTTAAGDNGVAIGGNVNTRADNGSMAVGFLNGNVTFGNPPQPGPHQG